MCKIQGVKAEMKDTNFISDKEIKKCKRYIVLMLFGVALGAGNFVWGIATEKIFSVAAGLFCGPICAFCTWRMINVIEKYARMSETEKRLAQMMASMDEINEQMREDVRDCSLCLHCDPSYGCSIHNTIAGGCKDFLNKYDQ